MNSHSTSNLSEETACLIPSAVCSLQQQLLFSLSLSLSVPVCSVVIVSHTRRGTAGCLSPVGGGCTTSAWYQNIANVLPVWTSRLLALELSWTWLLVSLRRQLYKMFTEAAVS